MALPAHTQKLGTIKARFFEPCHTASGEFYLFVLVCLAIVYRHAGWAAQSWDLRPYVAAASALLAHDNPYDVSVLSQHALKLGLYDYSGLPYLYQPFFARLLTPLLFVSIPTASTLWLCFKALCCGVILFAATRIMQTRITPFAALAFALFIMFYRGASADFQTGNVAIFEAALLAIWLLGIKARMLWPAAAALTVLVSIKPVPGLLLFEEMRRRSWRLVIIASLCIVAALGLQLADGSLLKYANYMIGEEFRGYWDQLKLGVYNHSVTSAIYRLMDETYLTQPLLPMPMAAPFAVLVLLIILLGSTIWGLRVCDDTEKQLPEAKAASAAILITGLLSLSPRVADYTMAWTIVPVSLLTAFAWRRKNLVLMGLIAVSVLIIHGHTKFSLLIGAGWKQILIDRDTYGYLLLHAVGLYACLQTRRFCTASASEQTTEEKNT